MKRLLSETKTPRAVVITGAGWVASVFGPYGSVWRDTPSINQFGARGLVFDRYFADSSSSLDVLKSMWTCQHALHHQRAAQVQNPASWIAPLLHDAGESVMITDCPEVAEQAESMGFGEVLYLARPDHSDLPEHFTETHCAQLFSRAIEKAEDTNVRLLWLHLDYLEHRWDAPLALRGKWYDDEEQEPRSDIEPPHLSNCPAMDDEEILSWVQCYVDQIGVLDTCIDALLDVLSVDEIEENNEQSSKSPFETMVVFAGTSGMALGEHDWVGPGKGEFLSPRSQLPLMILGPNIPTLRIDQICQPCDVGQTLVRWFEPEITQWDSVRALNLIEFIDPARWVEPIEERVAVSISDNQFAIHTTRWHWVRNGEVQRLFLKPDDRYDANDVASRANEECAIFQQAFEDLEKAHLATDWGEVNRLEQALGNALKAL